ncbi:MAG: hypothetical protein ACRC0V_11290 [Fusobacteriaceae bacterium]
MKYKVIFGKVRNGGKSYGKNEILSLDPQDKDTEYLLKNKIIEEVLEKKNEKIKDNEIGSTGVDEKNDEFKAYVETLSDEQQQEIMELEENEIKILKSYGAGNREKFWKLSEENRKTFFKETASVRKDILKDI